MLFQDDMEPVVSNSLEVNVLLKNLQEICQYYKIVHAFGYTETTKNFLKASYETLDTFDFSVYSQEEFEQILRNKAEELSNQLDVAYEGWFKDTFAKIAYKLKTDSGVASKIADKLVIIKALSPEKMALVLNNKLGFAFYTPENLQKMIKYMDAAVKFASENEALLRETKKSFITRKMSSDQVKSALNKVRQESEILVEKYREIKQDATAAKGTFTDEEDTPASQGWTKEKVISVIQAWLDAGAGKLNKLKLILTNVEKWGYNFKVRPSIAMNSNSDYFPIVEVESIAKEEMEQLIRFIHETLSLYESVDSSIYRFVKKF